MTRASTTVRNAAWLLPLICSALPAAACGPAKVGRVVLGEATLESLGTALANNQVSAEQLVRAYLARIRDCDRDRHAILSINPHASAQARLRDAERREGKVRGPLHGVPIVVKDNIDVAGTVTTAGSLALAVARASVVALIAPTTGPAWQIDLVNGDRSVGSSSTLAAMAGTPHLTVPMARIEGLPIGLSFFAGAGSEATLLSLGHSFELLPRR